MPPGGTWQHAARTQADAAAATESRVAGAAATMTAAIHSLLHMEGLRLSMDERLEMLSY